MSTPGDYAGKYLPIQARGLAAVRGQRRDHTVEVHIVLGYADDPRPGWPFPFPHPDPPPMADDRFDADLAALRRALAARD
jgi:hypothetical protein